MSNTSQTISTNKPDYCARCNRYHYPGRHTKSYKNYLKSDHWMDVRRRYWASNMPKKCKICGTTKNLNLHHRSYAHLGAERIGIDFFVLCRTHHHIVHKEAGDLTWKNMTKAVKKLRKRYAKNQAHKRYMKNKRIRESIDKNNK